MQNSARRPLGDESAYVRGCGARRGVQWANVLGGCLVIATTALPVGSAGVSPRRRQESWRRAKDGEPQMAKWREVWRRVSAEAEEARALMVRDRTKGEERFQVLIEEHGEDGMILLKRGQAFQRLGALPLAYADFLQAEDLFPMQDWKDAAKHAAAEIEAKLPSHAPDKRLKTGLDSLELSPEIRTPALEAFRLADFSPEASIQFARTALLAAIRKMRGGDVRDPRGAVGPNYLDEAIRRLQDDRKISEVTAHEMHTIQRLRNAVEHRRQNVTSHDARACAFVLMAILVAVCSSKKIGG